MTDLSKTVLFVAASIDEMILQRLNYLCLLVLHRELKCKFDSRHFYRPKVIKYRVVLHEVILAQQFQYKYKKNREKK